MEHWPDILKTDLENKRQRWEQALQDAGMRLPSDQDLADQLARVFAFSDFVADSCIRDPLLLTQLWNGGDLRQAPSAGAYGRRLNAFLEGTADIDDLAGRLRRFRRREMVAIARRDLTGKADLAATSGVHRATDALKMLMAGAAVTTMAFALLRHGIKHLATVESEIRQWMDEHEYESVAQMRGSMSQQSCPDPSSFERAQYMKAISQFPVST